MHFIVYETTCLINGKKYRGAHVCKHLNDDYLGSGTLLKKAIAKYGFDAFERKILKECSSHEEMYKAEAEYIDIDWISRPDTYNLKLGGEGGWDFINKTGRRWTEEKRKAWSIEVRKLIRNGSLKLRRKTKPEGMTGMRHSTESKKKISENNRMNLDQSVIERRMRDIDDVNYPVRGSIQKLADRWQVSHTQVSRFIAKHRSVA